MPISLTDYEMNLVIDPQIILTKNRIIQKVYKLFGGLAEEYRNIIDAAGLTNVAQVGAKISRGENYQGLPYVILDYPRQFNKQDAFAIRTFFWWGNFFSITIQLSGRFQQQLVLPIENSIHRGIFDTWSLGCSDNPWLHHFEPDNYRPIAREGNYDLSTYPFIKMAKKIPLEKWDDVELFFIDNFYFLIRTLCIRLQSDETNL